jgi:acetylornithine deacetylase/succinyl-diaminopimelate desuccinylase-like protein
MKVAEGKIREVTGYI